LAALPELTAEAVAGEATAASRPDLGVIEAYRLPAPELPLDLFGPWSDWLQAAAESTGAPVDYAGCALLALMAGTIGNAAEAVPWLGWREPSVLWVGLVGHPGDGKTPAIDPLRRAMAPIEREAREKFEEDLRAWEAAAAEAKAAHAAWERTCKIAASKGEPSPPFPDAAHKPDRPAFRRVLIGNTTVEALTSAMLGEPRGLLATHDELTGWLGSFGRYSGAAAADRAFWLECWGARPHRVDRVKYGHAYIPRLAVSLLGTAQPERLNALLFIGEDDGLPSRMLWAWPEPCPRVRPDRVPDLERLTRALRWLRSIPFRAEDDGTERPQALRLTEEAADFFEGWWKPQTNDVHDEGGLMKSALAKGPAQVLRLALVLTLADAAHDGGQLPGGIETGAVARAVALWEDYFVPMAARVLGDAALPEVDRDSRTLARWIAKTQPATINARELRRNVRLPGLKEARRVDAALESLVEVGWLEAAPAREGDRGGRHRKDYRTRAALWAALNEVTG